MSGADRPRTSAPIFGRAEVSRSAFRACLALASGLSAVAVTTDRRWSSLDLDVEIRVVR